MEGSFIWEGLASQSHVVYVPSVRSPIHSSFTSDGARHGTEPCWGVPMGSRHASNVLS